VRTPVAKPVADRFETGQDVGLVEPELAETRRAVTARGAGCLAIDDLTTQDLASISWSGTEEHLRSVAGYLARVGAGEVEYLAVRDLDGRPVAKAGIDYRPRPDAGTILQLATHPDLWGLGLATAVIAAAESGIRRRGLTVARLSVGQDNARARAIYERLGYAPVGTSQASWEAEAPDGSRYVHQTILTDMAKPL
jgi:ribosomal protein S18 acetylase RimI-like enzyme